MQDNFIAEHKNFCKSISFFFILVLCFFFRSFQTDAAAISAIASGNWSSTSTWSSGSIPTSSDDVTIDNNYTVTMNSVGAACNSLTLGSSTAAATGALTFGAYDLTVGGTVTFGGTYSTAATGTITMVSGSSLTCASFAAVNFGAFTPSTGTVIFTGTNSLPSNFTSFYNLTISSGTTTLGAATTASGNLVVNGILAGSSTLTLSGASKTVDGSGTISAPVTFSVSHSISSSAALSISSAITINSSVTVTNNGSITSTDNTMGIAGSSGSTWTNASGSSLSISGPFLTAASTNVTTSGTNTITYNGASQTVHASTSYYNLTITATSGTATAGGNITVGGAFDISAGTFNGSTYTLTLNGSFSCAGTFTPSTSALVITSSMTLPAKVTSVSTLTIGSASKTGLTLTLSANINVSGSFSSYNSTVSTTASAYSVTMSGGNTNLGLDNYLATFTGNGTFTLSANHYVRGGFTIAGPIVINAFWSTYDNLGSILTSTSSSGITGTGSIATVGSTNVIVAGPLLPSGSLSLSSGVTLTVTYNGSSAQTLKNPSSTTYPYNVIISNSAGVSIPSGGSTIPGNLTISAGAVLSCGANTLNMSSATSVVTNNGTVTSTGSGGITGVSGTTWSNANGSALTISGPFMTTSGTVLSTSGTNTITYSGSSQTVHASSSYNNLTIAGTTTLGGNITVNGTLTINSSSTLDVSASNYTVTVNGTFTNNGTYNQGSTTTTFSGSSAQTVPSGTFNALTINNSNGVSLGGAVTVSGTITLTSGSIDLGSNNLTAGSVSGAGSSSYIKTSDGGSLIMNVASSSVTFPVGTSSYTPVTIDNSAGSPQNFDVSISDNALQSGTTGSALSSHVVNKTWLIHNEGSSPDATITLQWNASDEASGFDRTSCYLSHYTNGAWDAGTVSSASGSDPYTLSRGGLTSFSPFSIGDGISALPVKLIAFNAKRAGNSTILNWTTASELNNEGFEVERSENAIDWNRIGFINGGGNSNSIRNYDYADNTPLTSEMTYYQLKQVDFNGQHSYSSVQCVHRNATELTVSASIWFGQEDNILHVNIPASTTSVITNVKIIDMSGRTISQQRVTDKNAMVSTNQLAPGIYTVEVANEIAVYSQRFIKN